MKLRLPLILRARVLSSGTSIAAACILSSGWVAGATISTDVTLDDTSSASSAAGSIVAGTTYGKITSNGALSLSNMTLHVVHGTTGSLDSWAGLIMNDAHNTASFTFENAVLTGDGNLAFAFKSGNANQHPSIDLRTLDGSAFTGRFLLLDQWNNGLTATYSGTSLQNAEIVLSKDGSSHTVGGASMNTGTNRYENTLNLTGSASLSGISAEAKGTSANARDSVVTTSGAGTNTLTLTGGCTTNQTSVFAGNAGTSSEYFNLVQQGGSQTFSGTSYFGSVSVTGGTLTLSGTAAVKGDVNVTGGVLNLSGATIDAGKNVSLAGGSINNLTLRVGNTLTQTSGGGTLGDLTLSGGTVSFSGMNGSSYSLTGTLTLGALTTFDFSGSTGYADGTTLFSGVSFGEGFTWNDSEWARYFTLTGTAENWQIVYDQGSSSLKLAANTAAQLTWDNAASTGVWNTTDANWGDASTTFRTGDYVTFAGTTGTVNVDDAGVLASKVTITGGSDFVLEGGMVTAPVNIDGASSLTVNNTVAGAVSLADSSALIVGTGTLDGIVTLEDAGSKLVLTKADAFTSSATVVGSGILEVNWGTQSGNVDAQLGAFDGTLQITSGRYEGGSTPTGAPFIAISDGGQLRLTGGTWNQSFTLSGGGWTGADGALSKGALLMEGGTLSGSVSLSGNASLQVAGGATGTVSGAIAGNNYTLTKEGTGTLILSNAGNANLNLTIAEGIVSVEQGKTYNFGTVTVQGGATLQTHWNARFDIANLSMKDGSYLDLNDGGSNTTPTLTFTKMTVQGMAHIKNQVNGALKIAGTIVGEGGTLHFTTGSGTNALTISSEMSGTLNITKDVAGTLNITNTGNTYEGDMSVSAGEINVSGGINGENNTYAAVNNGTLRVSGANGNIRNNAVTVKRNGSTAATINHATVGTSSITKESAETQGSMDNAAIEISAAAYAIDSVALSNSLMTLKSAGTVTLANVTLSGTTKLAGDASASGTKTVLFSGNGNSLTMPSGETGTGHDTFDTGAATLTSVYVYDISSHFSDVTLTGHLAIDVSALLDTLPGGYDYVAFDFGTANNVVLDESFTASVTPNAYNSGELAGTVSGHVVYFDTRNVPEPTGSALALVGFSGLLLRRRRKS